MKGKIFIILIISGVIGLFLASFVSVSAQEATYLREYLLPVTAYVPTGEPIKRLGNECSLMATDGGFPIPTDTACSDLREKTITCYELDQPVVVNIVEKTFNISFYNITHPLLLDRSTKGIQTLVLISTRSVAVTHVLKGFLIYRLQCPFQRQLYHLVLETADP